MRGKGLIAYGAENGSSVSGRQHFPAIVSNPLDVVGAGDSLFASTSVSLCSVANIMEASAIGTCMASLAVRNVGNILINKNMLQHQLHALFK